MSVGHKVVVRGIIIGRSPVGEGSVRIHVYTDAFGLMSAFAQSGREERSQLRAHLEVGTRGLFWLVKGKNMWRVTGISQTENMLFALSHDRGAQQSLSRVLSFVRQFVRGEGSDPYFFSTLWNFVASLPGLSTDTTRSAECIAVLRMLASLGYVEATPQIQPFLDLPYATPLFEAAHQQRTPLLKVINESITASGLSD